MQTAAALSAAALALGTLAALLGLSWPGWPKLSGAKPTTLWIAAGMVLTFAALAILVRWSLLPAGAALIFLALTDLRRFSLPWAGLAVLAVAAGLDIALHPATTVERLITGVAAGLVLLSIRHGSGRPPRLGLGDVLLGGCAAALVGWKLAPAALALAALAPIAIQRFSGRQGPAPFGFWIAVAALVAAFANTLVESPAPLHG